MKHLLAISIGPVQSFIAAGRRTADLYAGSALLQDTARAVAASLPASTQFIFPADRSQAAANRLLAVVDGDPARIAQEARAAARSHLQAQWSWAMERIGDLSGRIDQERSREQLRHALELYAAWQPLNGIDYPEARERAELLLGGRKALRDFGPAFQHDEGVPKSPLDPALASVIDPEDWSEAQASAQGSNRPLRIRPSETLDAISLLKRIYGVVHLGTVPSTRVFARRSVDPSADSAILAEDEGTPEPQPYFALLLADGDRMGARIAALKTQEDHRRFSSALGRFASKAKELVEQCGGHPVYAGGDDLLAFLPVTTALGCARNLHQLFVEMVPGNTGVLCEGTPCSLSIGLALVHYRQPLSLSLEAARAAEEEAKKKRSSLAVAYQPRSGRRVLACSNWNDLQGFKSWDSVIDLYQRGAVPRGLAYDLRKLASEWDPSRMGDKGLLQEVKRVLKQKGLEAALDVEELGLDKRDQLLAFTEQLRIGRFLVPLGVEVHA